MKFQPGHTYGFKPGQSGNPSGRAKMTPEQRAAKAAAQKVSLEMVEGIIATTRDDGVAPELRFKARVEVLRIGGYEQAADLLDDAFASLDDVPTDKLHEILARADA